MRVGRCAWSAGVEERTACLAPKRRWARASWNTELACLALAPDGLPPGPAPGHARGYAAKAPGKAMAQPTTCRPASEAAEGAKPGGAATAEQGSVRAGEHPGASHGLRRPSTVG